MVNVANGNLLVQSDDISIHERGIDLAFRRTYNSQSTYDAVGADGATPAVYGNGWTNTFDAHLVYNSQRNIMSVYDIDGARYDYTSDGQGHWIAPAGMQGTTLELAAPAPYQGYVWTKKTGTIYYFFHPLQPASTAGYAGRTYQIIGRNHNNAVTFTYSWANGDASNTENITQVVALHGDGHSLTLKFAKFGNYTELASIVRPDGLAVTYGYDASGNLIAASRPGNAVDDATRTQAISSLEEQYGYYAGSHEIQSVVSPRYVASNGADGSYYTFSYSANSTSGQLTTVNEYGQMTFTPNDGTATALQSGSNATLSNPTPWRTTTFSWQANGPTYVSDTQGHAGYWYQNVNGNITERKVWTGSVWLVTQSCWDANLNETCTIDPRGNETDYGYDGNGNTLFMQQPQVATAWGTGRPTSRYVYDQFNNVVAYCDANYIWKNGQSSCTNVPGETRYVYDYSDSAEPYGKLTDRYTPLGYHTKLAYNTSVSGGDTGLPTDVLGDSMTENDGTTRSPQEHLTYDGYGNVVSYNKGLANWSIVYDDLNRVVKATDPDGVTSRTCYNTDGAISARQSAYQYALDNGTLCGPNSVSFTYDVDGNTLTETHHYQNSPGTIEKWYDGEDRLVEVVEPTNDVQSLTSTDGTQKASPDLFPWLTRYLYDLSVNGTVSMQGGSAYAAHGNLFKTERYLPGKQITLQGNGTTYTVTASARAGKKRVAIAKHGVARVLVPAPRNAFPGLVMLKAPRANTRVAFAVRGAATALPAGSWYDVSGQSYDNADRKTADYRYVPGSDAIAATTSVYDSGATGLLVQEINGVGDQKNLQYDNVGQIANIAFVVSSSSTYTPGRSYSYYPDGTQAAVSNAEFGTWSMTYDSDGRLATSAEPVGGGSGIPAGPAAAIANSGVLSNPATISYSYDADGLPSGVQVNSINQSEKYSYRVDGLKSDTQYSASNSTISWSYSQAGRLTSRTDPSGSDATTYDGYGHRSTWTNPSGSYTDYQYDAEDQPISITEPTQPGVAPATQAMTIFRTATGEVAGSMDWGSRGAGSAYLDGVPMPTVGQVGNSGWVWQEAVVDTRNLVTIGQVMEDSTGAVIASEPYTFDNAGRAVQLDPEWRESPPGGPDWWAADAWATYTYDAENHVTSATTTGATGGAPSVAYAWGPTGHPVTATFDLGTSLVANESRSYHWLGSQMLFSTSQSGQILDYKLGLDGEMLYVDQAQSGPAYFDRDDSGRAIASHGPGWTSGIGPGVLSSETWSFGYKSGTTPMLYSSAYGIVPAYAATDGVGDTVTTLQGVRAYNSIDRQWTTPDAYEGDISDPMSQAKYMWNNNNPFAYSDPSGYCAGDCILPAPPNAPQPPSAYPTNHLNPDGKHTNDMLLEAGGLGSEGAGVAGFAAGLLTDGATKGGVLGFAVTAAWTLTFGDKGIEPGFYSDTTYRDDGTAVTYSFFKPLAGSKVQGFTQITTFDAQGGSKTLTVFDDGTSTRTSVADPARDPFPSTKREEF